MRRDLPEPPEILTRTNWKSWKKDIEKHARKEGVWKYCDPSAPEKYYPELHEPEKPHVSTVRPEAESIIDLGEDDFIELSSVVDLYWKQMHVYEKIQSGLEVIFRLIRYHVDEEYLNFIRNAQTPLEQMTALSAKFKEFRLGSLQPRWERIQKLASKAEVQELFELWNALFTDCDGYHSGNARNQDAFWECVETAGYSSANWLPLTSQNWIENPDAVESRYYEACTQPHSVVRRESTASLHRIQIPSYESDQFHTLELESIAPRHWIKTSNTVNYGDGCAQTRSPAKREFIDSPYYVSDSESTVSIGHASLSPQLSSRAGRSDQRGEVSGGDLEITGLLRQLVRQAEKAKPNCDDLDKW
ncbi:hypothetical protein N7447_007543 [Penicillium robsamsonii]|uniref:uncharacterized protein n=1 Tax=Penicillium robsamsonii TaxID=1792511 RepID=UPI00254971EC|nr:uncharacterized protein N7447_007543 [Penicillium robsamsonii]KAJ5817535.1 hypothetical protein N7447_007543 [Penicillium robsamsonii]